MIIRQIIEISSKPSVELQKLSDSGLLREIFPELVALDAVMVSENNKLAHKNNFYHTLQVLDHIAAVSTSPILRWAAVLHDIGKPRCQSFDSGSGRWTFWNHASISSKMSVPILSAHTVPQEWWYNIKKLVYLHMRPIALVKKDITDSAVRRVMTEAGDLLSDLMILAEADITSHNREIYLKNLQKVKEMMESVYQKDLWSTTNPAFDGNWIMDNFELQDQSQIGILKDHLKKQILFHGIQNTKEDLWPELQKKAKELGIPEKTSMTQELLNTGKKPDTSI